MDNTPDIKTALRKAYLLGQTYWQQADSEYTSQHRKADETQAKFEQLVTDTVAALTSPEKVGGYEREAFDVSDSMSRIPTVARLYYTGLGSRRYRRASTQPGPGEALVFRSNVEYELNRLAARAALSADGGDKRDALTDGEFRDLVNQVTQTAKAFGQTQQLRERIRADLECVRHFARNAERYRVLRDVATDLLNAPGIPCIAVPVFGNKGTMYNGADADRVVDAAIAANQAEGE